MKFSSSLLGASCLIASWASTTSATWFDASSAPLSQHIVILGTIFVNLPSDCLVSGYVIPASNLLHPFASLWQTDTAKAAIEKRQGTEGSGTPNATETHHHHYHNGTGSDAECTAEFHHHNVTGTQTAAGLSPQTTNANFLVHDFAPITAAAAPTAASGGAAAASSTSGCHHHHHHHDNATSTATSGSSTLSNNNSGDLSSSDSSDGATAANSTHHHHHHDHNGTDSAGSSSTVSLTVIPLPAATGAGA